MRRETPRDAPLLVSIREQKAALSVQPHKHHKLWNRVILSDQSDLILNCQADILNEHEGYNFPVSVPRRLNTKTILFPYDLEQRVSVFLVTVATVTKQQGELRWAAG